MNYKGREHIIKPGDVFFINCMNHHYYGTLGNAPWEFKFLHFHGNNSEEVYDIIYNFYGAVIHAGPGNVVERMLDEAVRLSEESSLYFESQMMAHIAGLFSEIIRLSATRFGEIRNNKPNRVTDKAMEYIKKNYFTRIDLEDIARAAHASKYHFSRIFKKITGSSPYAFLMNYRINISKDKLKQTNKSIAEISIEVGFDSPSNYIKTFRTIEGATPKAYRKLWTGMR